MGTELHNPVATARRVLVVVTEASDEAPALHAAQELVQDAPDAKLTVLWAVADQSEPSPLDGGTVGAGPRPGPLVERRVCADHTAVAEAVEYAEREHAQLIVTCNRGVPTQRLVRRSPCSLLVLPVDGPPRPSGRIVVPVDFTPESEDAARFAIRLSRSRPEDGTYKPVELVHVYDVPVGHHKMGWTYDQFKKRLALVAERRIRGMAQRLATEGGVVETSCRCGSRVASTVLDLARERQCGALVLGSRPRTPVVGLLLPGAVERIVLSASMSVWVIRSGLRRLGFAEAMWCR